MAEKLPQATSLRNLGAGFASMIRKVEAAAAKLHSEMEDVAEHAVTGVEKVRGEVKKVRAMADDIHDAANQMTNGAPPLDDGGQSSGQQSNG